MGQPIRDVQGVDHLRHRATMFLVNMCSPSLASSTADCPMSTPEISHDSPSLACPALGNPLRRAPHTSGRPASQTCHDGDVGARRRGCYAYPQASTPRPGASEDSGAAGERAHENTAQRSPRKHVHIAQLPSVARSGSPVSSSARHLDSRRLADSDRRPQTRRLRPQTTDRRLAQTSWEWLRSRPHEHCNLQGESPSRVIRARAPVCHQPPARHTQKSQTVTHCTLHGYPAPSSVAVSRLQSSRRTMPAAAAHPPLSAPWCSGRSTHRCHARLGS